MLDPNALKEVVILGNSLQSYLIALIVFIGVFGVIKIFKGVVLFRLKILAKKTKTQVDDLIVEMVDKIGSWPLYVFFALFFAFNFVNVALWLKNGIKYILIITLTYYIIKAIQIAIDYSSQKYIETTGRKKSISKLMSTIVKIIVWLIAIMLILQNMGIKITSLIAGLGVGGIAIAFALQNVLSDIFASFSIYLDKPFEEGDFIVIGTDSGTVKHIGIKSTRLKTLKGQELVVSNRELTEARINNFKKMEKRRVLFNVGITYHTPIAKMKKIPSFVKEIFKSVKDATLDRVHFSEFGDFSLNYEIVYFVKSKDYKKYMDINQKVNLAIKGKFEKEKIEFAFPTQSIYLEK